MNHQRDWDQYLRPTNHIPRVLSDYYQAVFEEAEHLGIAFPGKSPVIQTR